MEVSTLSSLHYGDPQGSSRIVSDREFYEPFEKRSKQTVH